jgi:hypothetical protein
MIPYYAVLKELHLAPQYRAKMGHRLVTHAIVRARQKAMRLKCLNAYLRARVTQTVLDANVVSVLRTNHEAMAKQRAVL